MKKIFTSLSILALIATSSVFTSCSSDDNASEQVQQDPLLGKWTVEKVDVKISIDGAVVQDQKGVDITNEVEMYFEFLQGNVANFYQKQIASGQVNQATGTYSVSGSDITIVIENEPQTFEYSINNGELTLSIVEEEMYEGQLYQITTTFHLF